jgi:tRNA (guanine-N7-)-methyltransferase
MTVRRSQRLSPEEIAPFTLDLPEPPVPFDWAAIFGNDHPIELEIGSGKGLFLVRSAESRPDTNFVGVEIVRKYQLFTATRLAKRQLTNARMACADARLFLRDRIATGTLAVLHVYFPDPWWKTRHHKRRVFTSAFVAAAVRVLALGGRLEVATDVPDYAAMVRGLVAAQPTLVPLPPSQPGEPRHDLDYLTNFERKFRKQGKPIHRLTYERVEPFSGEPLVARLES